MQFHVKRLRAFYLNWIRALYKFRYNNNNFKYMAHLQAADVDERHLAGQFKLAYFHGKGLCSGINTVRLRPTD